MQRPYGEQFKSWNKISYNSDMAIIDLEQYRAFWRKRSQAKMNPEMIPQLESGRAEAKRLAQVLVDEFGIKRVYLLERCGNYNRK